MDLGRGCGADSDPGDRCLPKTAWSGARTTGQALSLRILEALGRARMVPFASPVPCSGGAAALASPASSVAPGQS